ncbi:SGNH/GDSL hydrolase family protein [Mariniblastus fucicola]|uniref:GDSL-like Lipase/Acylhydrolase n=1 Tax=Mariniblastus fucicola TaxID=980251 RepID=A0A5B9P1X7_9BACT|nr:GDSL-type esterase/lipase family protein [Mariniblastus fucicola]QEG20264.1 GDSL-like Lipase/Acylhydrolase [Mariniblastus fucicola]
MRYLKLILALLTIASGLLVFPNRIPEFAGLWLVWCSVRNFQDRLTRFELLAIPAWLAIKWPEPTVALAVFVLVVVLASVTLGRSRDASQVSRSGRQLSCLLVLWLSWAVWLAHHHSGYSGSQRTGNPDGPVVCLGDSLTDFGYPEKLGTRIPQPIADFGFNGYTTTDGLKLAPDIVALNPHTVVIELGGHDYKNGESRSQTEVKMRELILRFQECGANVVLVEIPRGFINDPWYGLEREQARSHDLALIPDTMIRRLIYWSPIIPPGSLVPEASRLSRDGLHPNDAGNQMMAETVAGYLDFGR